MLKYEFEGGHESRALYEEAFYITAYYNAMLKNPGKKAHSILKTLLGMVVYGCVMLVAGIIIWLVSSFRILPPVLITAGVLVLCVFLKSYLSYRRIIMSSMEDKKHKQYTISETGIAFKDDEKEMATEWDNIAYAVINAYTISFMPRTFNSVFYVLPVRYADEIKEYLRKCDRADIIVDNR